MRLIEHIFAIRSNEKELLPKLLDINIEKQHQGVNKVS